MEYVLDSERLRKAEHYSVRSYFLWTTFFLGSAKYTYRVTRRMCEGGKFHRALVRSNSRPLLVEYLELLEWSLRLFEVDKSSKDSDP
mmetsp:Transcript_15368/g.31172  ORF Transcript_15368/g.31172 Transcript_15368/m.31172 type:complete len:87 (+) Transcript_15368:50-310(+)